MYEISFVLYDKNNDHDNCYIPINLCLDQKTYENYGTGELITKCSQLITSKKKENFRVL